MSLPIQIAIGFIVTIAIIALSVVFGVATFSVSLRILRSSGVDLATATLVSKAMCFITIGFFMPMTTGLAQWVNSGQWPGPLIWIVTGASCVVGAGSQLLSFLSGSYSDYISDKTPGSVDVVKTTHQETHIQTPPSETTTVPIALAPKTP